MEPERIATNTYDFENIRTTGLTYVDKTAVLYPLVNGSIGNQFFLARLVNMYDGYCFDDSLTRVFNPVSLGRCLDSADMRSYWFETGTPGWLMSYARKAPIDVDNLYLGDADLGTFEPANPSMPAVLFQTGYLTIKDVWGQDVGMMYRLGFPNKEVAAAFNLLFSGERAA